MPYVSRAARDRKLWITPKEARAHVCETERCAHEEAEQQIRHALADTKIKLRWADSKPIDYYTNGRAKFGMDQPPKEPDAVQNEDHDWLKAKLDWESGRTHDPQAYFFNKLRRMNAQGTGKKPHQWDDERPLLLLKSDVMKLWPKDDGPGDEVDELPILAEVPGSLTSQRPTITGDTSSNSPKPPSPPKLSKSAGEKAFKTWWAESETEGGREPTSRACEKWATQNALSRDWVRPWSSGLRSNKKGGRPAKPRS